MSLKHFQDPPFGIHSLFYFARGAFFFITLFVLLLGVNIAQTSSLLILPFSRGYFRKFNRFCANSWWGICVQAALKINGAKLIVSGDKIPPLENAIVYANHQQMSDIFIIMMFALTKSRLGDLKWFVKDILKYVPGVGWGMLFLDCVFVKRNWDADKEKIHSVFSKFQKDKIPVWLISFVEGTRITPHKLIRSQTYAREKGLPVLNHVMIPRTKGFAATVQGLSDHTCIVYDITIGYPQGTPSLWQIAKGTAKEFHLHVRRFDLSTLQEEERVSNMGSWLLARYVEKDRLLNSFYQLGVFDKLQKLNLDELR